MQNGAHSYVQTQFTTVGQGELLLMLYDGALRFLAQAREKMVERDFAAKGVLISKALDVISELDASLNQEVGGDLARNLHQLYFLCSTKLLQANLRMSPELLDSAVEILTGLRNAYAQIMGKPEVKAAAQQIAQRQQNSAVPTRRPMAPPPPPPTSVSRLFAQTVYGSAGADILPTTQQAAQATVRDAEKAAEHLTRQAAETATAALQESARIKGSDNWIAPDTPPTPPVVQNGLQPPVAQSGLRQAASRYGKMLQQS